MENMYPNIPKAPITQPIEEAPEVGGIYDMPPMPMQPMQQMCCIPVYCMPMQGMPSMISPAMEPNMPMYGGAQDPNSIYGTQPMTGMPDMYGTQPMMGMPRYGAQPTPY